LVSLSICERQKVLISLSVCERQCVTTARKHNICARLAIRQYQDSRIYQNNQCVGNCCSSLRYLEIKKPWHVRSRSSTWELVNRGRMCLVYDGLGDYVCVTRWRDVHVGCHWPQCLHVCCCIIQTHLHVCLTNFWTIRIESMLSWIQKQIHCSVSYGHITHYVGLLPKPFVVIVA